MRLRKKLIIAISLMVLIATGVVTSVLILKNNTKNVEPLYVTIDYNDGSNIIKHEFQEEIVLGGKERKNYDLIGFTIGQKLNSHYDYEGLPENQKVAVGTKVKANSGKTYYAVWRGKVQNVTLHLADAMDDRTYAKYHTYDSKIIPVYYGESFNIDNSEFSHIFQKDTGCKLVSLQSGEQSYEIDSTIKITAPIDLSLVYSPDFNRTIIKQNNGSADIVIAGEGNNYLLTNLVRTNYELQGYFLAPDSFAYEWDTYKTANPLIQPNQNICVSTGETIYHAIWRGESLGNVTFETTNSDSLESYLGKESFAVNYGDQFDVDAEEYKSLFHKITGQLFNSFEYNGSIYENDQTVVFTTANPVLEMMFAGPFHRVTLNYNIESEPDIVYIGKNRQIDFINKTLPRLGTIGYYSENISYKEKADKNFILANTVGFVGEGDKNYYLIWEPDEVTIKLNKGTDDNVLGTMDDIKVRYTESIKLPDNTLDRGNNWKFLGWSLDFKGQVVLPDSSNVIMTVGGYLDEAVVNESDKLIINLYAIWERIATTVHFDYNGGTQGSVLSNTYLVNTTDNVLPTKEETSTERTNYIFRGWSSTQYVEYSDIPTDESGAIADANVWLDGASYTAGSENITLYAVWERETVVITFMHNNGTNQYTDLKLPKDAPTSLVDNVEIQAANNDWVIIAWSDNPDGSGNLYGLESLNDLTPSAPQTLYAVWSTPLNRFNFIPIDENSCGFTRSSTYPTGKVLIPRVYQGKLITTIGNPTETNLQNAAFNSCYYITEIYIPNSITIIRPYAFSGCSAVSIYLPESIIDIMDNAFLNCKSLAEINIPASVESMVCNNSFNDCIVLKAINVDSENKNYSSVDGVLFNKDRSILLRCPQTVTEYNIPNYVTQLADYSFRSCQFTSIILHDNITSIGSYAFSQSSLTSIIIPLGIESYGTGIFYNCKALSSAILPEDIINIPNALFNGCSSLTETTIPRGVKGMAATVFFECTSLTEITIPSGVKTIGANTFYGCSSLTIYAEFASKPAGWVSNWNPNNRPVIWLYE